MTRRTVLFLVEDSARRDRLSLLLAFHCCLFAAEFICCDFHVCVCHVFRFLLAQISSLQRSHLLYTSLTQIIKTVTLRSSYFKKDNFDKVETSSCCKITCHATNVVQITFNKIFPQENDCLQKVTT
jgi:hypothetical protein